MTSVVLGMLMVLALGISVLLLVAVPARRAGRDVLTEHGEEVLARVKDETGDLLDSAKDKAGELREKVATRS